MKKKSRRRKLPAWALADRKFALASIAILVFLALAGLTNWLAGGPSAEAQNSTSTYDR
jgi:hypothetical protein